MTSPARLTPHAPLTRYHQFELERVVKIANSRLAVLRGVQSFEIAPMKGDAYHREFQTQIRAIPVIKSPCPEFRYNLSLRHSGCASLDELAWDLVGKAYRFFTDSQLANLAAMAERAVAPAIANAAVSTIAPRLVSVGASFEFGEPTPRISIDIEMLGDNLALGIERVLGLDVAHLEREVARLVTEHETRDAARIRAEDLRASGWIEQTALRIMDSAGLGRRETIEMVCREGWVNLRFCGTEGDEIDATLHQAHGVIAGWAMPEDRRWNLKDRDLIFWGEGIPDTLRGSLVGRRLGEIFQNPELPPDATIRIVEEVTSVDPESDDDEIDGWLRLLLDIPIAEIDRATGEPRDAWSSSDSMGGE